MKTMTKDLPGVKVEEGFVSQNRIENLFNRVSKNSPLCSGG